VLNLHRIRQLSNFHGSFSQCSLDRLLLKEIIPLTQHFAIFVAKTTLYLSRIVTHLYHSTLLIIITKTKIATGAMHFIIGCSTCRTLFLKTKKIGIGCSCYNRKAIHKFLFTKNFTKRNRAQLLAQSY